MKKSARVFQGCAFFFPGNSRGRGKHDLHGDDVLIICWHMRNATSVLFLSLFCRIFFFIFITQETSLRQDFLDKVRLHCIALFTIEFK